MGIGLRIGIELRIGIGLKIGFRVRVRVSISNRNRFQKTEDEYFSNGRNGCAAQDQGNEEGHRLRKNGLKPGTRG